MAEIKSKATLLDYEEEGKQAKIEFDFTKFDSDPYHPKTMKWDSDHAESEYLINLLFDNVKDSKTLTIQKKTDTKVDTIIKNAYKKKLVGDKKGGIDVFQIRFTVDGIANSIRLLNPRVTFVKDVRENGTNFFVFTLKTDKAPSKGGVGV